VAVNKNSPQWSGCGIVDEPEKDEHNLRMWRALADDKEELQAGLEEWTPIPGSVLRSFFAE
jgi:hypothetical protein